MTSLRDLEADLARVLKALEPHTGYAEALAESLSGTSLRYDRSSTLLQYRPRLQGVVFRAWDGLGWVEAATSQPDADGLKEVEHNLLHRLFHPRGTAPVPGASATGRAEARTTTAKPVEGLSLEARLALAKSYHAWATDVKGVANAYVGLSNFHDERLFLSTAGAFRYQEIERLSMTVTPIAMESGKVEFDYLSRGGTGGTEVFERVTEAEVRETATAAVQLLTARAAPTGRMTVLLDPGTAGTFAHESFGHGTEADQLLRDRSYLKPLLGQELGPECLTLVDDGPHPGDWGSIFFDDEGYPAQRTVLVDRGRFVEVLHDRESAAAMGRKPTGNCRRADFLSRPFVRMTNTIVEPSTWSFDELVKEAKDGVLLESCTSGIEDPLGGQMQIKVKKGHRIAGGAVGEILPSMALSGRVLDVLRSIRGVGRPDAFEVQPGFCGKGHTDMLPTGTGGSYVLAEAIVGPA